MEEGERKIGLGKGRKVFGTIFCLLYVTYVSFVPCLWLRPECREACLMRDGPQGAEKGPPFGKRCQGEARGSKIGPSLCQVSRRAFSFMCEGLFVKP